MTKLEAIIHLYRTRKITEAKAYQLAKSRELTVSEIDELKSKIELINNPPAYEESDEGIEDEVSEE